MGAQVIIDAAQVLSHLAATKLIYLLHQSVKELAVVAHDDGRAVKSLDGFFQHILGLHVQVIGRLIENQEVDRLQQQFNHGQPAALASTQHLDEFLAGLPSKHESTQEVVYLQPDVARSHLVNRLEDSEILIQQLGLVLGEISYLHVMAYLQGSRERNFAHDTLHQRGFSLSVLTHESHFLTPLNGHGDMAEYDMVTIRFAYLIAYHGIVATAQARGELQAHGGVVHLIYFDGHNLGQLLDAALHLHGLGRFITETLYELLRVGYLLLLVLVGAQLLLPAFLAQDHILIILHAIVLHPTASNLQSTIGNVIDESPVVAHQHYGVGTLGQILLQPLDTLYVQVVSRLVQQQHVRMTQKNLGQLNTHTPPPRELPGRAVEIFPKETQTHKRALYLRLVVLATQHQVALMLLRKGLHQPGVIIALVILPCSQLFLQAVYALFQLNGIGESLAGFFPHGGIVLQFHYLRQVTHCGVVGHGYRSRRGLLQSAQYLEHRALARPVFAHQGNAVAVIDHKTHVMEQRLHAKLDFQSLNGNHTL